MPPVRLLVSVRDLGEARLAIATGVDLVDLKDPADGALGGLPPARIAALVAALRDAGVAVPVSATIGDVPASDRDEVLRRVARVAACGVDYVKVGVTGGPAGRALVRALAAACPSTAPRAGGPALVPVLLADDGIDAPVLDEVLGSRSFAGVMLDTARKGAGSLLDRVPARELAAFVRAVRASGRLCGIAGSLRAADLPRLLALQPDFAGFRGAACAGARDGPLDAVALRGLRAGLAADPQAGRRAANPA